MRTSTAVVSAPGCQRCTPAMDVDLLSAQARSLLFKSKCTHLKLAIYHRKQANKHTHTYRQHSLTSLGPTQTRPSYLKHFLMIVILYLYAGTLEKDDFSCQRVDRLKNEIVNNAENHTGGDVSSGGYDVIWRCSLLGGYNVCTLQESVTSPLFIV